jgi:hypothetical protein
MAGKEQRWVMLESFSVNLFIFTVLCGIGMAGTGLWRQIRLSLRKTRLAAMEARNDELHKRGLTLEARHKETIESIRRTEDEKRMLIGQIQQIRTRIKTAGIENFELIFELGEVDAGSRLFTGALGIGHSLTIGTMVTSESKLRGVRHLLEIWAAGQDEAMRIGKLAYPADNGFTVQGLQVKTPIKVAAQ